MQESPLVSIVMGSDSDLPVMEGAVELLREFGVAFEAGVLSAHRSPDEAHAFASGAAERGVKVIIAAAGGAAHLAGVVASAALIPVIGVPMPTDRAGGIDSLLSTVQMPAGVPVATTGMGNSGAPNAALLAVRILALCDEGLAGALKEYKCRMRDGVLEADKRVKKWLADNTGQA